jgi:hypothetical protein
VKATYCTEQDGKKGKKGQKVGPDYKLTSMPEALCRFSRIVLAKRK